ncbi:hypothetical protein ACLOJK_037939 [Asimina triloba]
MAELGCLVVVPTWDGQPPDGHHFKPVRSAKAAVSFVYCAFYLFQIELGVVSENPPKVMDSTSKRSCLLSIFPATALLCLVFFFGSSFVATDNNERITRRETFDSGLLKLTVSDDGCKDQCRPPGSEPLPKGIIQATSSLEMRPLWGFPKEKSIPSAVLASDAEQQVLDMWFAKRFLHPDVVYEYDYIFLWDEDLGVENFNPMSYLSIVKEEGLEISQPGLDIAKSQVLRGLDRRADCSWVFFVILVQPSSKSNTLVEDKGDRSMKVGVVDSEYIVHLGVATLGVSKKNKPSLMADENRVYKPKATKHKTTKTDHKTSKPRGRGRQDKPKGGQEYKTSRNLDTNGGQPCLVRKQSYIELEIFSRRWKEAVVEDKCWTDPYPEPAKAGSS